MRTKKPVPIHNRTTQEMAPIAAAAEPSAAPDVAFHNKPTMLLSTIDASKPPVELDADDVSSVDDLVDLLRERDELRAALADKEQALAQARQALAERDAEMERLMGWLPGDAAPATGIAAADVLAESDKLRELVQKLQQPSDLRSDREKLRWLTMEVSLLSTSLRRLTDNQTP